jgi:hypothetical protein
MHAGDSKTGTQLGPGQGPTDYAQVVSRIKAWGQELGFAAIGIATTDVTAARPRLMRWLELGRHGEMDYMAKHANLRATPQGLLPDTLSVISARLPYWPAAADAQQILAASEQAYVSRYALGRDYHKTMRRRLQQLIDRLHREAAALQLDRTLCLPCVFRFGSGAGNRVCGAIGRCLARQAHAVADACRIVAFSRRNLYHLAAAPRQTDRRSLR